MNVLINFLKRAGWSLWRHKFRNILLIVVFSAIFAVTLISFMVYSATSYQVEITQKAVANAVTLQGPLVNGYGSSSQIGINYTDAKWFASSDYVERYNVVAAQVMMDLEGIDPVFPSGNDEIYQEYLEYRDALDQPYDKDAYAVWQSDVQSGAYRSHLANGNAEEGYVDEIYVDEEKQRYHYVKSSPNYSQEENERYEALYNALMNYDDRFHYQVSAISDSEYFDSFSSGGYSLVAGEHFRSDGEEKDVILISQQAAEANGLKVGDKLKLQFDATTQDMAKFYYPREWEVTVVGIFTPPDTEFSQKGYTAANFAYVSQEGMMRYIESMYQDTLLWFPSLNRVTAYIDSPDHVDAFVEETYGKFDVVEMTDQTSPPTGTNIDELLSGGSFSTADPEWADQAFSGFIGDLFSRKPWYVLMLDRGWYDMVAAPLENVSTVTLAMGIFLLVSAFVVLLLVSILTVRKRKREFGILLSMGENKLRVFLQVFAEQAVPLLLAVAVGFAVGVPFASAFGNQLLSGQASEANQMYADDKLTYLEEQLNGNDYDVEDTLTIRSAANVTAQAQMQFRLDMRITALYFAAAFVMLFLTVLVEMILLLRLAPARILTRRN